MTDADYKFMAHMVEEICAGATFVRVVLLIENRSFKILLALRSLNIGLNALSTELIVFQKVLLVPSHLFLVTYVTFPPFS